MEEPSNRANRPLTRDSNWLVRVKLLLVVQWVRDRLRLVEPSNKVNNLLDRAKLLLGKFRVSDSIIKITKKYRLNCSQHRLL